MTMAHARDVMEMELNPEHKHFARVLAAKQSMAASILTATARVRDALLRPVNDDGLDALLQKVKGTGGVRDAEVSRVSESGNVNTVSATDLLN